MNTINNKSLWVDYWRIRFRPYFFNGRLNGEVVFEFLTNDLFALLQNFAVKYLRRLIEP